MSVCKRERVAHRIPSRLKDEHAHPNVYLLLQTVNDKSDSFNGTIAIQTAKQQSNEIIQLFRDHHTLHERTIHQLGVDNKFCKILVLALMNLLRNSLKQRERVHTTNST